MSKLQELINELCPDGVEYKKLKNICEKITTGKLNANAMVEGGEYPFYTCDAEPYRIDKYAFDEEAILISGNGSKVGHVNYYKGKFNAYQRTYVLYDFKEVNIKFLLHYLRGNLRNYIMIHCKKGSIPYITLPMLQDFKLPVPPLPVQEEIVKILDKMTDYVTGLKAELALQKEVFVYYKNKIFERIDKKCYVPLNTIAKQERGKNRGQIIKDAFSVTQKGIIRTTDYFGEKTKITSENTSNYYILKPGWFAYSPSRINVGSFNYLRVNYDVIISPLNKVFSVKKEKIIPEFLYQYMTTTAGFSNMLKYREGIEGTGRWHLEFDDMAKMSIPLLSIEKQSEIVDKLRKFDILCNDLSSGLPAEIEARQKQYEYYRDKLLSFKEISHDTI